MRFGLRLSVQCTMEEDLQAHYQGNLEQVRLARDAGFELVSVGQHYLSPPFQALQLFPVLAGVAAESGTMRIASAVALLPLHNPVDLAEQTATVDIMSGGRFILGVALGYREVEYRSFGLERADRLPRFVESLSVMKRLWTEESVTHQGRYFSLHEASMAIRPLQRPYPPIWIGGNTDAMVQRAARLGHPWLANPHAHIDTLERQLELYRQTLDEHNHTAHMTDYPIMLEGYVAQTKAKALQIAGPHLEAKYRAYSKWGQDKVMGNESFDTTIEKLAPGRYILGSPQECVDLIGQYQERLGVNWTILRLQWPGLGTADALRAIELLGKSVIPVFQGNRASSSRV